MANTTQTAERFKTMLTLPDDVLDGFRSLDTTTRDAYIVALRRIGWTLSSIAEASGITRERVRQIAKSYAAVIVDGVEVEPEKDTEPLLEGKNLALPDPPAKPVRTPRQFIEPSPDVLTRLLELQPLAQRHRANAADSRNKEAADEYTRLIYVTSTEDKVPLYRLAKRLGVTHGALRFRLARYGYSTVKAS